MLGLHCCTGFSLVAASGSYSQLRCADPSVRWLLLLRSTVSRASVVVACGLRGCCSQALEHRLSVCGTWAYLLCGMWDLSRPGIEPLSPTLVGSFFTTEPPGKTKACDFFKGRVLGDHLYQVVQFPSIFYFKKISGLPWRSSG